MKKIAMSTILAVGFAIVSLLSTPPMAHAVTKNVPVDPDDPVARAYRRTLETPANSAITGQLPSNDSSNPAVTAEPNDPIAMAFRRSLGTTSDTSLDLVGSETPNDISIPPAVNELPIPRLMRLSKG